MFVADFIGSPPMNFLDFDGGLAEGRDGDRRPGRQGRRAGSARGCRARRRLALGIRPEHIRFDDASKLRGAVYGTEYLGTTQIVAVETADGIVKARVPAEVRLSTGDTVGLTLDGRAAVAVRQAIRPAPSAPRCTTEAHHG